MESVMAALAGDSPAIPHSQNHHLSKLCKIYQGRMCGGNRYSPVGTIRRTGGTV